MQVKTVVDAGMSLLVAYPRPDPAVRRVSVRCQSPNSCALAATSDTALKRRRSQGCAGKGIPVYTAAAMSSSGRRSSRRPCRSGAAILIALAVAMMVATGTPAPHLHQGNTPGLYNEAHVLETLAAAPQAAPPTERPPVLGIAPIAAAAPSGPDSLVPAPALRLADPRAPPTS